MLAIRTQSGGNSLIGWIVLGSSFWCCSWSALYNRLVRLRALVREGFSGITVQLRRRADLVPNLVETVQGYATHEREVFEEVTAAAPRRLRPAVSKPPPRPTRR